MTILETLLAAGWLLVAGLSTLGVLAWLRGLSPELPADPGPWPPVLVLLPLRAADEAEAARVADCLACLAAQEYCGPWRAAVVLETRTDPAFAVAEAAAAATGGRFTVLVAGPTPGRAQKLHNLLAGLATRRPEEMLVTLDGDTRPPSWWLRELTRPVRTGKAPAASGYRWTLTEGGLPARLVALADRGGSTFGRPRWFNLCWGGSLALGDEALARLDLPALWGDAVSDDLVVTAALRRAGLRPWTPRRVLVPSPVSHSWRSMVGFGRRQYLLIRLHAPGYWVLGLAVHGLPVAGAAVMLAAAMRGSVAAWGVLALALALQQWRAGLRAEVARRVLAEPWAGQVARELWRDRLLLPLLPLLHLGVYLSSAFGRRLHWGGRVYRVDGPHRVRLEGAR